MSQQAGSASGAVLGKVTSHSPLIDRPRRRPEVGHRSLGLELQWRTNSRRRVCLPSHGRALRDPAPAVPPYSRAGLASRSAGRRRRAWADAIERIGWVTALCARAISGRGCAWASGRTSAGRCHGVPGGDTSFSHPRACNRAARRKGQTSKGAIIRHHGRSRCHGGIRCTRAGRDVVGDLPWVNVDERPAGITVRIRSRARNRQDRMLTAESTGYTAKRRPPGCFPGVAECGCVAGEGSRGTGGVFNEEEQTEAMIIEGSSIGKERERWSSQQQKLGAQWQESDGGAEARANREGSSACMSSSGLKSKCTKTIQLSQRVSEDCLAISAGAICFYSSASVAAGQDGHRPWFRTHWRLSVMSGREERQTRPGQQSEASKTQTLQRRDYLSSSNDSSPHLSPQALLSASKLSPHHRCTISQGQPLKSRTNAHAFGTIHLLADLLEALLSCHLVAARTSSPQAVLSPRTIFWASPVSSRTPGTYYPPTIPVKHFSFCCACGRALAAIMAHNDCGQFTDSAFDPQPTFDFEDYNDMTARGAGMSMMAKSREASVATMYHHSGYDQSSSYEDMYQVERGDGVKSSSLRNAKASSEVVARLNEVQQVRNGGMKRAGQMAQPDGYQAVGPTKRRLDSGKVEKSERARNAANHRHSKKERPDSQDGTGERSDEDEGPGGEKKERYREKNRQAAAKCRDKKKKNTEELDKKYKVVAAENAARKQEVRMLRDEFCRIRELALQHAPDQCICSSLHAFNMQQAVKEASQMARTMGDMPMMDDSNDGRESSVVTSSDSAGTSSHGYTFADPTRSFDYASGYPESRRG
nr:isoform 2 of cyclic amp-dependent transcription factor atf-7 [Quercus suber]